MIRMILKVVVVIMIKTVSTLINCYRINQTFRINKGGNNSGRYLIKRRTFSEGRLQIFGELAEKEGVAGGAT